MASSKVMIESFRSSSPRWERHIVALNDCVSGRNRDTGCCLEYFEMSDVIDKCVCFVTSHYFGLCCCSFFLNVIQVSERQPAQQKIAT